jgi:hypothetical protein
MRAGDWHPCITCIKFNVAVALLAKAFGEHGLKWAANPLPKLRPTWMFGKRDFVGHGSESLKRQRGAVGDGHNAPLRQFVH